jgi:hypothetical protein
MPHKLNADRRAKIPKQKRRVTNCAAYDESLRMRGDLTVWISEEARAGIVKLSAIFATIAGALDLKQP